MSGRALERSGMPRSLRFIVALFALMAPGLVFAQGSPPAEKRIALVIGNAGYQADALNTPANDAGLIAQTLQAAGFDVAGAGESVREVRATAGRRLGAGRAGARHADRLQRRPGHGSARGAGPLWALCPGSGPDDARRRPAP